MYLIIYFYIFNHFAASCKMTRRNRTQEEHAIFEEITSTHIQIIVSAIKASNKKLITTIRKQNEETGATIRKGNKETKETLQKIAEEFQETLGETKNNKACESPILEKINECTSQIYLFTYRTEPPQHLYKTDTELLNAKRSMNSFWDHKLRARKAVFFKQYQNIILNDVLSEELQKEKPEIPC